MYSIHPFPCLPHTHTHRAQDSYTGNPDPMLPQVLSQYQSEISSITTNLSNISQEFGKLMQLLKERGNVPASDIIGEIQSKENEKLRLVRELGKHTPLIMTNLIVICEFVVQVCVKSESCV